MIKFMSSAESYESQNTIFVALSEIYSTSEFSLSQRFSQFKSKLVIIKSAF